MCWCGCRSVVDVRSSWSRAHVLPVQRGSRAALCVRTVRGSERGRMACGCSLVACFCSLVDSCCFSRACVSSVCGAVCVSVGVLCISVVRASAVCILLSRMCMSLSPRAVACVHRCDTAWIAYRTIVRVPCMCLSVHVSLRSLAVWCGGGAGARCAAVGQEGQRRGVQLDG